MEKYSEKIYIISYFEGKEKGVAEKMHKNGI